MHKSLELYDLLSDLCEQETPINLKSLINTLYPLDKDMSDNRTTYAATGYYSIARCAQNADDYTIRATFMRTDILCGDDKVKETDNVYILSVNCNDARAFKTWKVTYNDYYNLYLLINRTYNFFCYDQPVELSDITSMRKIIDNMSDRNNKLSYEHDTINLEFRIYNNEFKDKLVLWINYDLNNSEYIDILDFQANFEGGMIDEFF